MASNESNRWSPISSTDHAGIVWILSILAGAYTFLTLIIRFIIKWKTLGIDDWLYCAATVTAYATFATTYDALSHDLGKSNFRVPENELHIVSRALYAGRILFFLTLALSKCSVVMLCRRLFAEDMVKRRRACEITAACCAVWGLGAMIGVSVDCSPSLLLNPNDQCPGQLARWYVLSILEIISEIVAVGLSFVVIWKINIKMAMKVKVVAAFAFRLPLTATSILNIIFISSYLSSPNRNLGIVPSISTQIVHLVLSLFTATVPNLKSFLVNFNSGKLFVLPISQRGESALDYNNHSNSHSSTRDNGPKNSYPLQHVNNRPPNLQHEQRRDPPMMVQGQTRQYNRGDIAVTDTFYSHSDNNIVRTPPDAPAGPSGLGLKTTVAAAGRERSDDDDDGSREAPSFGAESQRRIWQRRES